jgi:ABC-type transport system involved in multi-copper enzyme maturation permease subunit
MTATITPYRSPRPVGRDGFAQLLHAEWTKFRTVRGWLIGTGAAALVMALLGLFGASGSHTSCSGPGGVFTCPTTPTGPGGEPVNDQFYFVHQPLHGDGSLTVRVSSLTGLVPSDNGVAAGTAGGSPSRSNLPTGTGGGVQPWTKAGIIVKANTTQGSAYAAIMVTGAHGVRMQDNFTDDIPGSPGAVSAASPRWLRLTRSGSTFTGHESADGTHWNEVGTAHLGALSSTVQAGLFVTSPAYSQIAHHLGGFSDTGHPTLATANFDHVSLQGGTAGATWAGAAVGIMPPAGAQPSAQPEPSNSGGFQQTSSGAFTITGSGDIAPDPNAGLTIQRTLSGAFAGLIVVIVLATMFITGEYRRGLIRTTLAASPRRARALAAKALVIGSVAFLVGLAAAAVAVPLGERILRHNGNFIYPVSTLTGLRVVVGTAAVLAVAAVLALAVGTLLRRSAAAVAAAIVLIVLPYFLSVASVLPVGAAQWLLRLTPAAGFAIQQSLTQYPQVIADYSPTNGYFPLAPWAGFAVLCGYAALTLALAAYLLRRRDA